MAIFQCSNDCGILGGGTKVTYCSCLGLNLFYGRACGFDFCKKKVDACSKDLALCGMSQLMYVAEIWLFGF